jgi:hypothetical protein
MALPRKLRRRTPRRRAECPGDLHDYADLPAQPRSKSRSCPASDRLERELGFPWPFTGRPRKNDLSGWTVTDDWPRPVPVTPAEVDVFERWFGDLFDELFGPCE